LPDTFNEKIILKAVVIDNGRNDSPKKNLPLKKETFRADIQIRELQTVFTVTE